MKTLLVRLSSMGDLIHTLPAVDDLSRMRPDVDLHWLCEAGFADIARLHPFVRQVHEMRWRQWRKDLLSPATWRQIGRLKQDLQQQHFDDVLDSQGLVKSALFAKIAHAPVKGLDGSSARERWAALAYHHNYAVPKDKNAVWRNRMLFAQAFGYALPDEQHFGLVVPESARFFSRIAPRQIHRQAAVIMQFLQQGQPIFNRPQFAVAAGGMQRHIIMCRQIRQSCALRHY